MHIGPFGDETSLAVRLPGMRQLSAKLAGPVTSYSPDPNTLVLDCDRGLRWPIVFGLIGAIALYIGFRLPKPTDLFFGAFGTSLLFASFLGFVVNRPRIVLSAKTTSLERLVRVWLPWGRRRRSTLSLKFADIREFVLGAEFEAAPGRPFVWHLIVVDSNNKRFPLTWHFFREPILRAAQQAARLTGKPLREESDPWNSSRWERWGYNFFR